MLELLAATLASFAAAFVNSIAGGGGLVSTPILFGLFPAAPPATLFGTNKAAMIWGTAWAARVYARHVRLPWRMLIPAIAAALAGGAAGAWLVTRVSGEEIRRLLPMLLAAVWIYTLLEKNLGQEHAPHRSPRAEVVVGTLISFGLGVYDGFFGPGTGSFFIFLFVRVLGFDFLHAAASAKVLNTATNLASVATFAAAGHVWWEFLVPMATANVLGSILGTRMALRHGSGLIRRVFLVVVGALILKAAFDAYAR